MNAPQSLPGISSVGEAELVIADLGRIMDALLAAVEEETVLVRGGKLSEAERLSAAKSELAGSYLATTERIKASRPFLARSLPDQLAELRRRHESFHAVLQINLTVLATAHAVTEGLIRGAHSEIARKNAPQVYSSSGRAAAPPRSMATPVSVSRTL